MNEKILQKYEHLELSIILIQIVTCLFVIQAKRMHSRTPPPPTHTHGARTRTHANTRRHAHTHTFVHVRIQSKHKENTSDLLQNHVISKSVNPTGKHVSCKQAWPLSGDV